MPVAVSCHGLPEPSFITRNRVTSDFKSNCIREPTPETPEPIQKILKVLFLNQDSNREAEPIGYIYIYIYIYIERERDLYIHIYR
jgi:hypothetical protein